MTSSFILFFSLITSSFILPISSANEKELKPAKHITAISDSMIFFIENPLVKVSLSTGFQSDPFEYTSFHKSHCKSIVLCGLALIRQHSCLKCSPPEGPPARWWSRLDWAHKEQGSASLRAAECPRPSRHE